MRTAALSEVSPGLAERATDSPPSAALHIKAVRKFYDELEAIRNVSFDVADGEFLSLLGPSGCGKSTLLMMVAGLIGATEGEISINGKAVSGPRREVGVVFQQPVLLPWRKVLDNVLFPIELLKLPRPQYEKRAIDLLRTHSRSRHSADGRAVQRVGCPHPRRDGRRVLAHLASKPKNRDLRHPQHSRGSVPLRPSAGDGPAAGDDRGGGDHRSAPSTPHRDDGGRRLQSPRAQAAKSDRGKP